eukprot:2764750-Prymnesium_polylepis.1
MRAPRVIQFPELAIKPVSCTCDGPSWRCSGWGVRVGCAPLAASCARARARCPRERGVHALLTTFECPD